MGPFEYPKTKNIAKEVVFDVSYITEKRQDGNNISFLIFKLSIKTFAKDVSKLLIAYSEPYSYSRLQFLIEELREKHKNSQSD